MDGFFLHRVEMKEAKQAVNRGRIIRAMEKDMTNDKLRPKTIAGWEALEDLYLKQLDEATKERDEAVELLKECDKTMCEKYSYEFHVKVKNFLSKLGGGEK